MNYKIFIPSEDQYANEYGLSYTNIHPIILNNEIFVTYWDELYFYADLNLIKIEFCFIDSEFDVSNVHEWREIFNKKILNSAMNDLNKIKVYRLTQYHPPLMSVDLSINFESLHVLPDEIVTSILMNLDIALK